MRTTNLIPYPLALRQAVLSADVVSLFLRMFSVVPGRLIPVGSVRGDPLTRLCRWAVFRERSLRKSLPRRKKSADLDPHERCQLILPDRSYLTPLPVS